MRLVLSVTMKASRTTGFESWSSSFPGDVWTKMPTIGSSRKTSVTTVTATKRKLSSHRLTGLRLSGVGTGRRLRRLLRLRLDARQEAVREHLRLPGLAQHLRDELLRV